MRKIILFTFLTVVIQLRAQVNLVSNPGFEQYSTCPTFGAQWNVCTGWNNVNMNSGSGSWGTPDYFNTCGSGGTMPPATFAGTCSPHAGNAMMAMVLYNSPFTDYREYLATQLTSTMQPATTYTLSFWLSNGTGVISPWTIRNIGVHFSSGPLSQTGWGVITVTPQCEITSNIVSNGWTNYTFTVSPTSPCNYLTIGAFRTDANNNPTMSFPNPGGNPSAYANYFVDDISLISPACGITVTPSSTVICAQGSPATMTASGAINYTWTPASSLSSSSGSVVVASPSVTTTYTLSGTNGTCNAGAVVTISVQSAPVISTSASTINVCPGKTATVSAFGASTYTWQPGNSTGSTVTLSPSVSTIYTVTGASLLGCVSTKTLALILQSTPVLAIVPSTSTVCFGAPVTFSMSGALGYTLQPWGLNTTAMVVTITPSATTVYTLTGNNSFGCTSSIINTVVVNSLPVLGINPLSSTLCNNSPASYTANGAVSYSWFPGTTVGPILNLLPPISSVVYTLVGMNALGCTATITKLLSVVNSPTLTANSTPSVICAGATVTLTANGSNTYTWNPGNLTAQTITLNPLTTGIYTVTGDYLGCIGSATVLILNPLSPTLTSGGNIDCNNAVTQLYLGSNSTNYSTIWAGPGIIGSVSSASVQVNAAGVYTAVLTDTVTGCSATSTISVSNSIGPVPVNIIPSTTLSCFPGPSVNLLVSSSASYTWFPSAAVSPSTGPVVSVNPSVTTVYSVVATLGVCSGSSAITISVNTTPTLTLSSSNNTLCAGSTATLSASGASSYIWIPGNSFGATVTLTPSSTTAYTVTGYNGICQSSSQTTLEVFPLPNLITGISPSSVCAGNTVTLTAAGGELLGWTSNNTFSAQPTILVTPSVTSVYLASGTNSMGCKSVKAVTVNVINLPAPIVFSSANTICSGGSVTLTAGGGTSYTWLPVNQTGSVVVVTPSVTTSYTLALQSSGCTNYTTVLIQTEECFGSNFGVTKACSIPELFNGNYYKISFSVTAVNGSSQDFRNVSLNDDLSQTFPSPCTYSIEGVPRLNSSGSGLKPNPLFDGRSELSLTAPNSSTLFAGRRDTLVFIVLLDPHGFYGSLKNSVIGFANSPTNQLLSDSSNTGFVWDPDKDGDPTNNNEPTLFEIGIIELFIPEGFSPNDDGINDVFEIKGLQGRKLNLTIFNRWGNKVYIKDNYDNSWDGRPNVNSVHFGNSRLPEGTYYFLIQFTDGNKEIMHGFVVLRY